MNTEPRISKTAGGIVVNPNGDVLVVSQHGDSWSLPKGHLEDGEDVAPVDQGAADAEGPDLIQVSA